MIISYIVVFAVGVVCGAFGYSYGYPAFKDKVKQVLGL